MARNEATREFQPPEKLPASKTLRKLYGFHPNWGKKPSKVVSACIRAMSSPGEIVLDPFSGCGVTPIEAARQARDHGIERARRGIGIDISPLSTFAAQMTAAPVSPDQVSAHRSLCDQIAAELNDEFGELYRTNCPNCGGPAMSTSTVFDATDETDDPRKRDWKPRLIRYSCERCETAGSKEATEEDGAEIETLWNHGRESSLQDWELIPNSRVNAYDGMTVSDLYTPRNWWATGRLKQAILEVPDEKARDMLRFQLSSSLRLTSMMAHEGGGPYQNNFLVFKTGMVESNPLSTFLSRTDDLAWIYQHTLPMWQALGIGSFEGGKSWIDDWNARSISELMDGERWIMLATGDAQKLSNLVAAGSVDYVHTDPPYCDQVPYLELHLPFVAVMDLATKEEYESLLSREIVITDSPERTELNNNDEGLSNYETMLRDSFAQVGKVLDKGRWASVWFCCQDEDVWRALSDALKLVGLEGQREHIVPRQDQSFKGKIEEYRNPLARILKQDILLHALKTGRSEIPRQIALNEATTLFEETALSLIRRKGYATTGEIYLEFVHACFKRFHEPPPNFDYVKLLENDDRFVASERTEKIGDKYKEVKAWRLTGTEDKSRITSY